MNKVFITFFIVVIFGSFGFAQESNSFSDKQYTATNLFRKGQLEFKLFNAVYTQQTFDGFEQLNSRSTYFSSFAQLLIGTNSTFNFGADLVYKSNLENDLAEASPFGVLRFDNFQDVALIQEDSLRNSEGIALQRRAQHGLAHIGPKIKINPFQKWKRLSLQQTLYIPLDKTVDGQWISFTQFFWDKRLSAKTNLFVEASLWFPLMSGSQVLPFFKLFYSYFPTKRWTIYAMTTVPVEYGLGTKFLLTPQLELEFLYTHYLPLDFLLDGNRPTTFNFGLRYTNF